MTARARVGRIRTRLAELYGVPCAPPHERVTGSELLSAELDEFGRDPVYEAAAHRAVG